MKMLKLNLFWFRVHGFKGLRWYYIGKYTLLDFIFPKEISLTTLKSKSLEQTLNEIEFFVQRKIYNKRLTFDFIPIKKTIKQRVEYYNKDTGKLYLGDWLPFLPEYKEEMIETVEQRYYTKRSSNEQYLIQKLPDLENMIIYCLTKSYGDLHNESGGDCNIRGKIRYKIGKHGFSLKKPHFYKVKEKRIWSEELEEKQKEQKSWEEADKKEKTRKEKAIETIQNYLASLIKSQLSKFINKISEDGFDKYKKIMEKELSLFECHHIPEAWNYMDRLYDDAFDVYLKKQKT